MSPKTSVDGTDIAQRQRSWENLLAATLTRWFRYDYLEKSVWTMTFSGPTFCAMNSGELVFFFFVS